MTVDQLTTIVEERLRQSLKTPMNGKKTAAPTTIVTPDKEEENSDGDHGGDDDDDGAVAPPKESVDANVDDDDESSLQGYRLDLDDLSSDDDSTVAPSKSPSSQPNGVANNMKLHQDDDDDLFEDM